MFTDFSAIVPFSDYSTIPKNRKVTIIDLPEEIGKDETPSIINIGNYYRGNLIKGSLQEYEVGYANEDILHFDYQKDVFVHEDAQIAFQVIIEFAEIYEKADGDPEKLKKYFQENYVVKLEDDEIM